ncbi:SctD/MshK family protein [Hyphobacterium sp.]|uniref:SctD/MshK family protein n=1 Tax=Hyphobacterium sp. TaxID=2004662 RepID=UPI003B51C862
MMPLGLVRVATAGLIAAAAGLAGLAVAPNTASSPVLSPSSAAGGPEPLVPSDISALSARLRATGLFPAAIPLADAIASNPEAAAAALGDQAEGANAAIPRPPIIALVREDGVWRIHAGGVITERERLIVGDELYDGWRIDEIGASQVILRRGDEVYPIYVFDPPGEG